MGKVNPYGTPPAMLGETKLIGDLYKRVIENYEKVTEMAKEGIGVNNAEAFRRSASFHALNLMRFIESLPKEQRESWGKLFRYLMESTRILLQDAQYEYRKFSPAIKERDKNTDKAIKEAMQRYNVQYD